MFDLQNQWRAEKGKAPLKGSELAYKMACTSVKAVGDANELDHDIGLKALIAAGYDPDIYFGENLACGGGYGAPDSTPWLIDLIDFSESSVHYNTAMGDFLSMVRLPYTQRTTAFGSVQYMVMNGLIRMTRHSTK